MKSRLAGLDLAWCSHNPSALAIASLEGKVLTLEGLQPSITGLPSILESLAHLPDLSGIAIDAPLIIENSTGQRLCERALSADYRSRKAGCHPSNQSLYPDALSVRLSSLLKQKGFQHLTSPHWQIECYPHPSIVECFGLSERLLYKKGRVSDKKSGQVALARYITQLECSDVLRLKIPNALRTCLSPAYINDLKGQSLKSNEDALDAIMCVYIAGLYQINAPGVLYGDAQQGYIWVPRIRCSV